MDSKNVNVNARDVALVHRLRRKYAANEPALDALLYHALSQGGQKDVGDVVRKTMAFFASPEGEAVYAEVVALLDPAAAATYSSVATAADTPRTTASLYEYSQEWTKALKQRKTTQTQTQSNSD